MPSDDRRPLTSLPWPESEWREALSTCVDSRGELLQRLGLQVEDGVGDVDTRAAEGPDFPLRVPRGFIARMAHGDPNDPLLRQVLPRVEEALPVPGYVPDPLGETALSPALGVLHKYHGRVLLLLSGVCPIHCRYCFRRHFPYGEHRLSGDTLEAALAYIAGDGDTKEVIWSGGDPLSLADHVLADLSARVAAIPHVERLRIHTRWPVVVPQRVTASLLRWLSNSRLRPIMVLHANHPSELTEELGIAARALRSAGVTLLNQAVLLRDVNDSAETLCRLSEALFAAGVLPYYLNLLDPVAGAAHFAVREEEARRLMGRVARLLPGYLVPRLVREEGGYGTKRLLLPEAPERGGH